MDILSLVLSLVSLTISIMAISWTIFEKLYLKPRSKVTGGICFIKNEIYESDSMVSLEITNYGPGNIIINSIACMNKVFLGKVLKKNIYGFIIYDYSNQFNPKLPFELEQYKTMTQLLPIKTELLFEKPINRFGFKDSIGRFHFMKRKDLEKLKKEYKIKVEEMKKEGIKFPIEQ